MLRLFKIAALINRLGLRLMGFRIFTLETEAGTLAVYHCGAGRGLPLLIVAHGMGEWAGSWRRVYWRLCGTFEIIAFDFPGYGFSRRPPGVVFADLARLDAALRAVCALAAGRPFILAGQSLGGWIALRLAQTGLPGLAQLVLFNPAGAPEAEIESKRVLLTDNSVAGYARLRTAIYGRNIPLRHLLLAPVYRQAQALPGYAGFVNSLEPVQMLKPGVKLPDVPVRFVFGAQDGLFGGVSRTWFIEQFPRSQVEILDCGHPPHIQAPADVARILRGLRVPDRA